jgi:hypothetical protein
MGYTEVRRKRYQLYFTTERTTPEDVQAERTKEQTIEEEAEKEAEIVPSEPAAQGKEEKDEYEEQPAQQGNLNETGEEVCKTGD